MKNILKQFVGWDTFWQRNEFQQAAIKLTLWHSLVIFVALVVASVVVVAIFSYSDLGIAIKLSPEIEDSEISLHELEEHLLDFVLIFNILVLGFGVFFSYVNAKRALRPIEEMYKKQEQFMSDVAHELRTPLTVMKAGAETLLRQARDTKTYVEYINDQDEEIDRMTNLVNDLLLLLKDKNTKTEEKTVINLNELISDRVKAFSAYAEKNNVSIIWFAKNEAVKINFTTPDMYRLLNNLLKNAIDYNLPGGQVVVALDKKESGIVLTISDTGVGISATKKERIFDRFYRVDQARISSTKTGSGLGLAIVKSIVDRHEGKIEVTSEEGKGTAVRVYLPVT